MPAQLPVSLTDVQHAARAHIIQTPLLEAPLLNEKLGFRLFVKAENVQYTGSFKVRGAFNQMAQLTLDEKARGVVAISSGNHAQAVAYAAAMFGVKATIVMPKDAPKLKLNNTRSYGADVIFYERETEERDDIGGRFAREHGVRMIHPYDDPRTVAGQGTCGIDIFEQSRALGILPDAIIANCSGGGLAAGIALTRDLYDTKKPAIYTAEPEEFDDMRRSLAAGTLARNAKANGSICDALMAPTPGGVPFPVLKHHQAVGLVASDACVEAAMSLAAEYFKLVLEPGGAVSIACACLNPGRFLGKTVVAIASGGNVDPEKYVGMLERGYKNRNMLFA